MDAVQPTVFNPAQLYLLKLFSEIRTEEELMDIKNLVGNYYAQKMNDHLNKLWDEGILDQQRLDEINQMDIHAWLREQKSLEQAGK